MTERKTRTTKPPPIHQWTHDGNRVLMVKCVGRDGKSYGGFEWPKSGPVVPERWSRKPDCDSGGLFGSAWGLHCGDGKTPDACAPWIVYAAKPENVILVGGGPKVKAVPGEDAEMPEVLFHGTMAQALRFTQAGRMAWVKANAGRKHAATGNSSSASSSGNYSSASSSGYSSSASSSGYSSSASSSGDSSSASSSGNSSSASSSGNSSSASSSGDSSSASSSGNYSSASSSGNYSSASSSGYYSSASSSGNYSSASSSGDSSSASSSGDYSISAACGNRCTVKPGARALGAATGRNVTWIVVKGAKLTVGWMDGDAWRARLFDSDTMDVLDGDTLLIDCGEIVEHRRDGLRITTKGGEPTSMSEDMQCAPETTPETDDQATPEPSEPATSEAERTTGTEAEEVIPAE
jgi:hypothetical protein